MSPVEVVGAIVSIYADYTKAGGVVRNVEEQARLQASLDNLYKWSVDWQLLFNTTKCKLMHLGPGNHRFKYRMGGLELEETSEENDVGVIVTDDLKPAAQCARAASRANAALG